mmetsp:Transcript_19346/g.41654  ORF Transcript_19346/g.41654 Transcript_19346/m.41654 type:complete len:446 (-) Transcript_19346:217-1554(-)|eukprot:CAMPEP_0168751650 /NCGR_PEP_ID=MMETSP0724-20121128/17948_1 /TAXON_ID=265536 /ORGANISM="Amphiprora sp., Strain CCMP467" /LENGTH=445 /DNA_ID=CAMNT_0008799811 /DNA_START=193 /DNA_END=1530 /DNA_ORIENTATION=+
MSHQMILFALCFALAADNDVLAFSTQGHHRSSSSSSSSSSRLNLYLDGKSGPVHPSSSNTEIITDTTRLGNLQVPTVGVGTISWSSNKMLELENLELQSLVNTACASNAALFDTAERYGSHLKTALGLGWGETEKLICKFLESAPTTTTTSSTTTSPVVATKFTPTPWRTTVESVVEACQDSCERLGVEQLDLYQLHMPDIVQPLRAFGKAQSKDEIYWQGLAECYNRGLVKNVGVCNYGPTLLEKCQDKLAQYNVPLASNQIAYSLLGRHDGAQSTLDYCNANNIKVLAFYPFAMGLLTGKYNNNVSSQNLARETLTTLTTNKKTMLEGLDLQKYAKGGTGAIPEGGIAPLLTVLEEVAQRNGKTVAQVALNYIICKGAIPIPGARSSLQLQDNIGATGWRLSDQEVSLLETTADSLGFGFDGAGFKRTSEKFVGYGVEKWSLD